MRKFESHLPITDGHGKPIEQAKIERFRQELLAKFGAFVVPNQRMWRYDGAKYLEILKIEIVTSTVQVPKKFLTDFKERLKESFRQTDILITTHCIRVI